MGIRNSFRNSLLSLLKSYLFFVLDSEFYWFFVWENPLYSVWVKIFLAKGASHQSLQSHPLSHHRIRQGLKMGSVSGSNVDINLWSNFSMKLTDSLDSFWVVLTHIWVMSQAETIITLKRPFGKTEQIHRMAIIFTHKSNFFHAGSFLVKILWFFFSFAKRSDNSIIKWE